MDGRPHRSVEQIEVIEHHIVEEGRRPIAGAIGAIGSSGALPPYSTVRRSTESYETRDVPLDRRYDFTGERDVSREASFLHTSASQQIEVTPTRSQFYSSGQGLDTSASRLYTSGPQLDTSGGSRAGQRVEFGDISGNTVVNNYGYDVHEIHTSEGGARVVETHGGGPIMETSRLESTRIEEVVERPLPQPPRPANGFARDHMGYIPVAKAPSGVLRTSSQSQVFTVPSPQIARTDSWRQIQQSDHDAFVRKDSYRKMQQSDELMGSVENSKSYAPQSQTSLVTRSSSHRREEEERGGGCWRRTVDYLTKLYRNTREREFTPRLLASLCCILLLLLLFFILLGIILNALFNTYSVSEFLLYPPVCDDCRRKDPNGYTASLPSSVFVHFYSPQQAHFELRGNSPFKSNSFTAIDFQTGYIAIADHALTDSNGRHTVCFIMPLDRSAIPSMDALKEAVSDSDYEIQAHFGWQEFWQFDAEPIEPVAANSKFTDRIEDCANAKWYFLKQAVHSRDASCSDCYDFCLPDWAVVRKEKYEDQSTIGVRRLDCFRLYVPEWRNFRVETDPSGGHFQYPLTSHDTRRDKSGNWVSWVPTSNAQSRSRRRV